MEQYIVSARKYRPSTFDTVVGQQALSTTLKNAISTGRLAHAYLFCGSRGVGKTSCARIFAKTINCLNRTAAGEACNECDSCRQFNENRSMNIIELDAASNNGVDDIRALIEQVMTPPAIGKYRVFIIDEVHMLSQQAFNAFLKTLEEPPAHAIFILATTEKHKIIPTILSRCQIFDFNRISVSDMVAHMRSVAEKEGIRTEDAALNVIAQKADGAMRDALSIFDQVAACTAGNITYQAAIENLNELDHGYYSRLLEAFVAQDVATALLIYKEIREKGFDSQFFINGLGQYMRDLALATNPSTLSLIETSDEVRADYAARAAKLHPTFLYRAMDLCNEADFNFRAATNKQFLIELTLIKLCQQLSPSSDEDAADEGRLKPLKAAATAGAVNATSTGTARPTPAAEVPRSAPAPAPASAPQAPKAPNYVPGAMSLGGMRRAMDAAKQAAPLVQTVAAAKHEPFTQADMEKAWAESASRRASEPALSAALNAAMPRLQGSNTVIARAANEMLQEILQRTVPALEKELRSALSNDSVKIEILISDEELPKKLWTDDRVLKDIISEYPGVGELIDKFQLRRL